MDLSTWRMDVLPRSPLSDNRSPVCQAVVSIVHPAIEYPRYSTYYWHTRRPKPTCICLSLDSFRRWFFTFFHSRFGAWKFRTEKLPATANPSPWKTPDAFWKSSFSRLKHSPIDLSEKERRRRSLITCRDLEKSVWATTDWKRCSQRIDVDRPIDPARDTDEE